MIRIKIYFFVAALLSEKMKALLTNQKVELNTRPANPEV